MDRDEVLLGRLATQRLSGPAAESPAHAVRELLCVQSQDAPLAKAMIAYRCAAATVAAVGAAVAAGQLVRTHILRPTWHYVAVEDLRWLLDLTSPKVEAAVAGRRRQLSLDEARFARAFAALAERLSGGRYATRRQLRETMAEAGVADPADPLFNEQLTHLLAAAEFRAVICSAPVLDAEHHYALVEEVVAPAPSRTREEAITELTGRFVAGHGPVALSELQRWTKLTLRELRSAVDALGDRVASETVDGVELWFGPGLDEVRPQRAWLLSIFDEAYLTYPKLNFPRSGGHPAGERPYRFAEAGMGVVLCDLKDVGAWKRRLVKGRPEISLDLDPGLDAGQRDAIEAAAERLRAAIGDVS